MVVTDRDNGFNDIVSEIQKAQKSFVIVGFPEGTVTHAQTKDKREKKAGQNMAEIAAANEYGTDKIPARPFMSTSYDENLPTINRALEGEYNKIVQGKSTVKLSLSKMGEYMKGLIVKKINEIQSPPNSPRTIALKGSSKPLIDFGQMRQAVTYKVFIQ
jgi:hypothetical protein